MELRWLLISCLIWTGCSLRTANQNTIEPNELIASDSCLTISMRYYQRFGYSVSNYFTFALIRAKDLNSDGIIDSIAIVVPIETSPDFEFCSKSASEIRENRLLLINLMGKNGSFLRKYRYDNVVSNEYLYPAKPGYEGIDVDSAHSGLSLIQDYGQGCYAQYGIYLSYAHEADDFRVDSIVYKDFCPGIGKPERVRRHYLDDDLLYLRYYDRSILIPFKREFGIVD